MKNNLENIDFNSVIDRNGSSYTDFRKKLKPAYRKALLDVAKGYFFLIGLLAISTLFIKLSHIAGLAAMLVCGFLIGYTLAYLHLFIHAAAHYNLHPEKKTNDQISDYAIGVFFGIQQKKYRKTHWLHHTHLGTKNDTEHTYFNELNARFLLMCLTGVYTLRVILSRRKTESEHLEKAGVPWSFGIYSVMFHGTLLLILFFTGGWKLIITWLAGLLIFFPALAALRQLLEHRDIEAFGRVDYEETDHGKVSRLFGKGVIDGSFGAAGFNRHLLHHWDPTVSYTSLQEVEDYLLNCPQTSNILKESKTSYWKTFLALFKI